MVRVVGIRFKKAGKVYYFDPAEFPITTGANVVVETARGMEYGEVAVGPKDVVEEQVVQPLKKVLRIGTERDAQIATENKRKEKEAFVLAQKKIEAHGLDMNLVDVEYTFDGSKNIFYFTSEGRVDFRELVRDLAGVFRTRIEMRQIGVRDEAKLLGGIGPCGRILCCTSFLGDFAPVSIRMAKDQNLSLNPSKISGLCGRLMCCLRYEQETYEAAKKDPTLAPGYMPPVQVPSEIPAHEFEGLEEKSQPRIRGLGENQLTARVAKAIETLDKLPREEVEDNRRRGDRPRDDERPASRAGGVGRIQGDGRVMPGPGLPQRKDAQGEPRRTQPQSQDRRPPKPQQGGPKSTGGDKPTQRPQQNQPSRKSSRPVQQGGRPNSERVNSPQDAGQGDRVRNERPQIEKLSVEKPPGEKIIGDKNPGEKSHRHRHHRGNRPRVGEKPQGQQAPKP